MCYDMVSKNLSNGELVMGLFTKKIGPVFLKENSDAEAYIEKLKALNEKAQGNLKQIACSR